MQSFYLQYSLFEISTEKILLLGQNIPNIFKCSSPTLNTVLIKLSPSPVNPYTRRAKYKALTNCHALLI